MTDPADPRLEELFRRLEELTLAQRTLAERVSRLESFPAPAPAPSPAPVPSPATAPESAPVPAPGPVGEQGARAPGVETAPAPAAAGGVPALPEGEDFLSAALTDPTVLIRFAPLAGRTLVALGGGFLLRALADSGVLPVRVGVVLGLAYAGLWLLLAARSRPESGLASAVFHSLGAAALAFPLLAETTVGFRVLEVPLACGLVASFGILMALVARRLASSLIAWMGLLGAVAAVLVIAVGTHDLPRPALALLALLFSLEVVAHPTRGGSWRWPPALALDAVLFFALAVSTRAGGPPEGYAPFSPNLILALGSVALVAHLGAVARRTLRLGRPLAILDGLHPAALVLVLGYGSAASPAGWAVGTLQATFAVLCYAGAFWFIDRRHGSGAAFHYFAGAALVLAVSGARLLLGEVALGACCLGLAVLTSLLGARYDRASLRLHAAVYLSVVALSGPMAARCAQGLFGNALGTWPPFDRLSGAVVLLSLVCYAIMLLFKRRREEAGWYTRIPEAVLAAWAGLGLAGGTARLLLPSVAGAPGPAADTGAAAALRTGTLAALCVALAALAKRLARPELRWLTYALLVVGAAKLVLEDLPGGRPATWFLGLALYGGSLLAVPRWVRPER
ncbi:MAG: hypothetical protein IT452_04040 [Planctomycetia bacterium]|nr:hypothetical protein [Planctomycetia bacterium]